MRTPLLRLLSWLWLAPVVLLASCATSRSYRQNIMFQTENSTSVDTARLQTALRKLSQNYVIKPNDYLQVRVYTNKGERLVDPNGELRFGVPGNQTLITGATQSGGELTRGGDVGSRPAGDSEFLVQSDGVVKLPMVGYVKITGNTLLQADSLLQLRYNAFYKDAFVATRVTNSRVFVLGTPGGMVVPLYNDNMNLIEILASVNGIDARTNTGSSGGATRYGKAFNIRLIRGDLKNPMVQVIDLSTIEGMRRADLRMQPNDIVYIEPVRRPFREALTDILPLLQVVTTAVTTVLLIINIKQ
ncbi:polysaccharide biosynthesis/export family protein [Hymenobacter sp. J193]|uniref:polysaccharide biosynthesis/export family protein n=1 Tax=Hymenobacter sp. J193 TaxID=2898429 RepID=UPI0021517798|nr:polysaccharide biosynthesis/export family protein [Hymenobacter sp. J193]MCR5887605.1 polysaccharide biosynthesis/export family protein [Hymenobacter sp. J193]